MSKASADQEPREETNKPPPRPIPSLRKPGCLELHIVVETWDFGLFIFKKQ